MNGKLSWVGLAVILSATAACQSESPGFGVGLSVSTPQAPTGLSDDVLRSIRILKLSSEGDGSTTPSYSTQIDLGATNHVLGRSEKLFYRPLAGATTVRISVDAVDGTGAVRAHGDTGFVSLTAGETSYADLVLLGVDDTDMGIDAGDDAEDQLSHVGFSRTVVVNKYKVGTVGTGMTELLDFPVPVLLVDPSLRSASMGGHIASDTASDVAFFGETADVCAPDVPPCRLDSEIQGYSPTTGGLNAWVRVPHLATVNSQGGSSTFTMFYGDPSRALDATAAQTSGQNVWKSGYQGVWHMGNLVGGLFLDSTAGQHHALATSLTLVSGVSGNAAHFDGVSGFADVPDAPALNFGPGADFTISVWSRTSQAGSTNDYPPLFNKGGDGYPRSYGIAARGPQDDTWSGGVSYSDDAGTQSLYGVGKPHEDGVWHLATTVRQANDISVYHDGSYSDCRCGFPSRDTQSPAPIRFGAQRMTSGAPYALYAGDEDEIRLSSVARSADWIAADYAVLNTAGTVVVGAEQAE